MKQIMATKTNYIFKVKLNQSFSLTRVVVSSEEQTGGVHTNSQHLFCALQGLACRCCGCSAPVCLGSHPAASGAAGLRGSGAAHLWDS